VVFVVDRAAKQNSLLCELVNNLNHDK